MRKPKKREFWNVRNVEERIVQKIQGIAEDEGKYTAQVIKEAVEALVQTKRKAR